MKIQELVEAVPFGSSTQPVAKPNIPPNQPSDQLGTTPPVTPGQTPAPTPGQQPAPTTGTAPAPATGAPPAAPAPNPALQQGMQTTMTDLDKIAAQIVGLKQKQQQMQQQMQQPPKI
jgi:hypothetical protein